MVAPGFLGAQKHLSLGAIHWLPARCAVMGSARAAQPLATSCLCLGEAFAELEDLLKQLQRGLKFDLVDGCF